MADDAASVSGKPAATRLAAALLLALPTLLAFPPAARAQLKPETLAACAACHGPAGNSPTPEIPSIAGQPQTFVENQLVLIREGLRDVPAMKDLLKGMSDAAIVELTQYYAAQKPTPAKSAVQPERYKAGNEIAKKAMCGTCHLADFSGQNQVPRLAGQHEAYLIASMKMFRDNPAPGRDTIMTATLRGMSDAELGQVATFLANYGP
jgi:cytochrome c553